MLLTRLRRLGHGPSGAFAFAGEGGALPPLVLEADLAEADAEPVEHSRLRAPGGAYHVEEVGGFAPTRLLPPGALEGLGLRPGKMHDTGPGESEPQLVRVEGPASDATLGRADEISRWLLAERAPLSLPDGRWDRLLYPIRDCEAFLRSRAPGS